MLLSGAAPGVARWLAVWVSDPELGDKRWGTEVPIGLGDKVPRLGKKIREALTEAQPICTVT